MLIFIVLVCCCAVQALLRPKVWASPADELVAGNRRGGMGPDRSWEGKARPCGADPAGPAQHDGFWRHRLGRPKRQPSLSCHTTTRL